MLDSISVASEVPPGPDETSPDKQAIPPNILFSRGIAALDAGDTAGAIRRLTEAIALRRGRPLYHYMLGKAPCAPSLVLRI